MPASHVGLTAKAQPILQWYLSAKVDCRIDFVLNDPRKPEPLIERTLEGPFGPGIHEIDLSRFGMGLEPNQQYEWWIAVVRNPEQRSRDSVAGGSVIRSVTAAAAPRDGAASDSELAALYAKEGIWYDALAALTAGIEAAPQDAQLREQRAGLLDQVGLGEVAARERGSGSIAR